MNIAVIGLGRMGVAVGYRAVQGGFNVIGFDPSVQASEKAAQDGIVTVSAIEDFVHHDITLFWLMVPQGDLVDTTIMKIMSIAQPGAIIIDGGNSKFTDSVRRAHELAEQAIFFLDCGTSGGVHGRESGFCLMVGGKKEAYDKAFSLLKAISAPGGCAYVGPSGTGHYVKMVHNGIEYGMMQAYAEGFHLLKEGEFKHNHLDLEAIAQVWSNGSVIRSWLLDLVTDVMKEDANLDDVVGTIAATGMGKWTVEQAELSNIPVPVIKKALEVRQWSERTGGNYATKIVSMLRNKFGGHAVAKK